MTPEIILATASIYNYAEKAGKTPDDVYEEWRKFAYGRFSEKKIRTENIVQVNEDDVNEIYAMYPTRDVNNHNRGLSKGAKTKQIIRKLLASGKTKEELLQAVEAELIEADSGKWLKDANTFFNNLPEPDVLQRTVQLDQQWQ